MTATDRRTATLDRRDFLRHAGLATTFVAAPAVLRAPAAWAQAPVPLTPGVPDGVKAVAGLEALKGKRPLIRLSYRPPNFETPLAVFTDTITPNDAFFVRYHLADIPEVDAATWRLKVGGDGAATAAEYSLDQLRSGFEQVELVAVCQCAGNRRGLSNPHVQGIEWGYGAMGNARWKGVRLRDVLTKAGIKPDAVEVVFDGADKPILSKTPDFVKSLPTAKAMDENTLIAFEMNGQPLPHWNGFPARLIVPGWAGTYWMKHLVTVDAVTKPSTNFWMATAYRIPLDKFPEVGRFKTQETAVNAPITEMVVNSIITYPVPGLTLRAGEASLLRGVAWDGGAGIKQVEISTNGGRSWTATTLGPDLGRFSFREWTYRFTPTPGNYQVMVKATNAAGAVQPAEAIFNPSGYHHNAIQSVAVTAAAGRGED
jgi:DMSO/TMAO reductase YedYZ molybdopterin-dependent catalytic subunit